MPVSEVPSVKPEIRDMLARAVGETAGPLRDVAGGGAISLDEAAAAAARNGIDMRMLELQHEPGGGAEALVPLQRGDA